MWAIFASLPNWKQNVFLDSSSEIAQKCYGCDKIFMMGFFLTVCIRIIQEMSEHAFKMLHIFFIQKVSHGEL